MHLRAASWFFAPLLLAACGKDSPAVPPDAGLADPEAFFSLQLGRCFEYTTADTKQIIPSLGMAVEALDTKQTPVPTHAITYRTNAVAMMDYVAFDGSSLKLYKRNLIGGNSYSYDPPLTLLTGPIRPGTAIDSSGAASIRDVSGTLLFDPPPQYSLRANIFDTSTWPLPAGKSVSGNRVVWTETPSVDRDDVRVFVAGSGDRTALDGFVQIDFNFSLDKNQKPLTYKLQTVRDLGADPSTAVPQCGLAQ